MATRVSAGLATCECFLRGETSSTWQPGGEEGIKLSTLRCIVFEATGRAVGCLCQSWFPRMGLEVWVTIPNSYTAVQLPGCMLRLLSVGVQGGRADPLWLATHIQSSKSNCREPKTNEKRLTNEGRPGCCEAPPRVSCSLHFATPCMH
jgi:hypothetical protein